MKFHFLVISFLVALPSTLVAQWSPASSPTGGIPLSFRTVAVFGDTLLAGADAGCCDAGGGIYRSIDRGQTWALCMNGAPTTTVDAILVQDGMVYAGAWNGLYRSTDYGVSWTRLPFDPVGNAVYGVATLSGRIFALAAYGVFRSTDDGSTWEWVLDGYDRISIAAAGGRILVGSYGPSGEIVASDNLGDDWAVSDSGMQGISWLHVGGFLVDGDRVYAAAGGRGVFRSDDAGRHWDSVNTGLPAGENPGFYAGAGSLIRYGDLIVAVVGQGGISALPDTGDTWTPIIEPGYDQSYFSNLALIGDSIYVSTAYGLYLMSGLQPPLTPVYTHYPTSFIPYWMVGGNQQLVAGATGYFWNGDTNGVWRSSNVGESWIESDSIPPGSRLRPLLHHNGMTWAADYNRLYRSLNDGAQWELSDTLPSYGELNGLIGRGDTLYAAVGSNPNFGEIGGVYRSIDSGQNWSLLGLNNHAVVSIAYPGEALLAGTVTSVWWSLDQGLNWYMADSSLPFGEPYRLATISGSVFATGPTGVYRSDEYGINWSRRDSGLPVNQYGFTEPTSIISYDQTLYVGTTTGIYHSTDLGMSWSSFGEGLPSDSQYVWALAAHEGFLFLTTSDGLWRRRLDGNPSIGVREQWNLVSVPYRVDDYSASAVFPTAITDAFGYHGGYVTEGILENGSAYWIKFAAAESVDFAGPWIVADTVAISVGWNLIGSVSVPIAVDGVGSIPGGIVTSDFYRYDGSYTKSSSIEPGMGYWVKAAQAGQLVLTPTAASPSTRITLRDFGEAPPAPPGRTSGVHPATFAMEQNYPNPFNPATNIRYALPVPGRIRLSVYNLIGEEVAVLVNGVQPAGYQQVSFDASHLPSGVYTYRLRTESATEVRKMMLLK